jgi:hypothetical protein
LVKSDPEIAAYTRRMRREEEKEDIRAFLDAYPRATGDNLEVIEFQESPDAVCSRSDGTFVGIEHTRIRRSPEDALWDSVLDKRGEMDITATIEEIERLIIQKTERRLRFKPEQCILLIAIYESDFDVVARVAARMLGWLEETGFEEIWLCDFKSIRDGAHRELRLFGLHPEKFRSISERSMFDQKPYG